MSDALPTEQKQTDDQTETKNCQSNTLERSSSRTNIWTGDNQEYEYAVAVVESIQAYNESDE